MALTSNIGSTLPASEQDREKVSVYNLALQEADSTFAGRLSKSVAGSANITLTRTEALNVFFIFTGALTGNIEVRFPASGGTARHLLVHNNTSGAFTLTVTVAGGSGVAVTQGERRTLVIDGSSVVMMNTGTIGSYTAVSAQAIWARVYHNAAQSISSATTTALAFNSERADTDTIHNNATNNTRLTATTAGLYQISGSASFAANATGFRLITVRLNGATVLAAQMITSPGGSDNAFLSISTLYALAATDYIELTAFQNSGGALNVVNAGNYSPEFMMVRLGGS